MGNTAPRASDQRRLIGEAYRAFEKDPLLHLHADFAFERREKLGAGGMGVVYRVWDRRHKRESALKLLIEPDGDPRKIARFVREARVTAGLDHPAIPAVYEYGRAGQGQFYILMKLVRGRTLAEELEELHASRAPREPFAWDELAPFIRVVLRVCEALSYAHARGVVHRDIKPENIMIGRHGEVYLMDWGLARRLDDAVEDAAEDEEGALDGSVFEAELSSPGGVVGTYAYMAPEQAKGSGVDARADIFALGAILFELIAGSPPIEAHSVAGVVAAMKGRITFPRGFDRRGPPGLSRLIRSCLNREPGRRPVDADALCATLRELRPTASRPWRLPMALGLVALFSLAWSLWLSMREAPSSPASIAVEGAPEPARPKAKPPAPAVDRAALKARLEEGARLIEAGEAEEALAAYGAAVELDPRCALAHRGRGEALEKLKRISRALEAYDQAGRRDPDDPEPFLRRGRIHLDVNAPAKAEVDFSEAEARGARDPELFVQRAEARRRLRDEGAAIADLDRAIALAPERADLYRRRGFVRMQIGLYAQARLDLDEACRRAPGDAVALRLQSVIAYKTGRYEDALREADRCLAIRPGYASAHRERGNALLGLGRLEDAIEAYSRAIKIVPRLGDAYVQRGVAHMRLNRLDRAAADCRAAQRFYPAESAKGRLLRTRLRSIEERRKRR